MIKKTLAVLLALCIVVVAVPFVSASTTDPTEANEQFAADLNAAAGETVCVLSEDKTTVNMTKNATLSTRVDFALRKSDCEVNLDLAGYVIDGKVTNYWGSNYNRKLTILDSSTKKTGYLDTYYAEDVYASDDVAASLFCNEINIEAGRTVCKLSDDGLTVIFIEDVYVNSMGNYIIGANFTLNLNDHCLERGISVGKGQNIVIKGSGSFGSVSMSGNNSRLTIDSDGTVLINEEISGLSSDRKVIVLNGVFAVPLRFNDDEQYIEAQTFLNYPTYGNTCTPEQEIAKTYGVDLYLFSGVTEKINYCYNTNDDETISLTAPLLPNQPALLEYMPKRDGYVFKGWYYSRSGNDPVGVNDKLSDGTTIYAQWLKIDDVQKESGDPTFNVEGNVSGFGLAGAQIRTIVNDNGKTGLRFVSRVSKQLLKDLEELGGKAPEYGHLFSAGVDLTDMYYNFSSINELGVGNCEAFNVYYDGDNYNMFTAVVTNIPRQYFSRNISARPYIKYMDASGIERAYYYTESESEYSIENGGGGYIATLNGIAQYMWDNDRPAEGTKAYDYIYQVLNGDGEIVVDDDDYKA